MKQLQRQRLLGFILFFSMTLGSVLIAQPARSSSFQVSPVRLIFTHQGSSSLLTVRNESNERLRLQVDSFAWDQNRQGEMILNTTDDLVVYPNLLAIEPGEQRNVRIGIKNPSVSAEKSYRVFLEELPSATKSTTTSVRVLTRIGVPVFVQPLKPEGRGKIEKLSFSKSALSFELANQGNVHIIPQSIKVKGMAATGTPVYEQDLSPWYVLAGGTRDFYLPVPKSNCSQIKELTVEITVDARVQLKEQATLGSGSC